VTHARAAGHGGDSTLQQKIASAERRRQFTKVHWWWWGLKAAPCPREQRAFRQAGGSIYFQRPGGRSGASTARPAAPAAPAAAATEHAPGGRTLREQSRARKPEPPAESAAPDSSQRVRVMAAPARGARRPNSYRCRCSRCHRARSGSSSHALRRLGEHRRTGKRVEEAKS
jgi:hypothetical protein